MRGATLIVALLLASRVWADPPDISAQQLLAGWKDQDPSTSMLAEVIASAFASGLSSSLGGKEVYCPPPDLKGRQVMIAFEQYHANGYRPALEKLAAKPPASDKPKARRCAGRATRPPLREDRPNSGV